MECNFFDIGHRYVISGDNRILSEKKWKKLIESDRTVPYSWRQQGAVAS